MVWWVGIKKRCQDGKRPFAEGYVSGEEAVCEQFAIEEKPG